MIYYTDPDESILIGISATERSEASIAKIVGKLLSYDMVEADSNAFDDVNEFATDTVVVGIADFTEELLDLLDKDIKVYLV